MSNIEIYKKNHSPEIYKCPGQTLAEIAKENGENVSYAIIIKHIIDFNEFTNVKVKMNKSQIEETAVIMFSDWGHKLKEVDIIHFFGQLKRGRYGELFESLDGCKLLKWFNAYLFDRHEITPKLAM